MKLRIPIGVAAVFVALCALNAVLLNVALNKLKPIVADADMLPATTSTVLTTLVPSESKPLSAYAKILEHPAFFRSRAPFVPTPPPVIAAPSPPPVVLVTPTITVTGIFIKDQLKKAFVVQPNEQQGTWVSEGENLVGWTVHSVKPSGISLNKNGRTLEFHLYPATGLP